MLHHIGSCDTRQQLGILSNPMDHGQRGEQGAGKTLHRLKKWKMMPFFLVGLSVRRQEAGRWKVEHLIPSEPIYLPSWSKEAEMQVRMAVGSALQTESTLAMCCWCHSWPPKQRWWSNISLWNNPPAELQLLHRSASLASFNCVSLWPCQQIDGAPLVTSFSCILLKGTTCTQEPPPCPSEVGSSRVTI